MKYQELLAPLKQSAQARLDEISGKVDGAKAEVESFNTLDVGFAAELKSEKDASYDEGFKDAQAKAGTPSEDKQFTLDELNAELKAATDPLNAQIADKNVQMESMQADMKSMQSQIDELKNAPVKEDTTPFDQTYVDSEVSKAIASMGLSAEDEAKFGDELKVMAEKLIKTPAVPPVSTEPAV